jgi:predicted ester cyclase
LNSPSFVYRELAKDIDQPVFIYLGHLSREKKDKIMSVGENKAIFRRYVQEIPKQGNLQVADQIFDRYIAHQPDGSTLERGPEDIKRFTREFHAAFSDVHVSIDDQIAEGDKVVSRYTIRGTLQGDFGGMAPTDKEIALKGVTTFRFCLLGEYIATSSSIHRKFIRNSSRSLSSSNQGPTMQRLCWQGLDREA